MHSAFVVRLVAAVAVLSLSGCGLLLSQADVPEYVRHPRTAYFVEGEVRDATTLAPIPDAEVTLETDRPGYVLVRRADPGGRFSIGYSAMSRRSGVVDSLLGDPADAQLVTRISIRARASGRCSPTHTFDVEAVPETGFLLLVADCDQRR